MKYYLLLFSVLIPFMGFSQDSTHVEAPKVITKLRMGQEIDLNSEIIRFDGVISDSRCPEGVECVWPGEAKLLFSYIKNGEWEKKEVVLSATRASANGPLIFDFENTEVFAFQLAPYPQVSRKIKHTEYQIGLYIQKKGGK